MFKKIPKVLSHVSSLNKGNFVTPEYILNKSDNSINLFHRFCPHRMFPISSPGKIIKEIKCQFHNFQWTEQGEPINNDKKIKCGSAQLGISGLIFKDFEEPNHKWVTDLSNEKNLEYSHSVLGESKGSWLWLMDAEADLLHLHEHGIHPFLSKQIKLEDIQLEQDDGWILQTHPHGWWLYIFPYGFIEYKNPGMLMVNSVYPKNSNNEFGFDWICQFYYDPLVDVEQRMIFETLVNVFKEDIETAEKQKGNYFPLMNTINQYEEHCVHWGKWFRHNKT